MKLDFETLKYLSQVGSGVVNTLVLIWVVTKVLSFEKSFQSIKTHLEYLIKDYNRRLDHAD